MSNELIPAGTYRARAIEAQLGKTAKGSEQVGISFAVLTPGFETQRLAYYGQFGEKSLAITVKALRACGWQGLDLSDLRGIETNEVNLVVEHEEYEGTTRAKVKWVNDVSAGVVKDVLDPTAAKSFAQRMRAAIAGVDAAAPKKNGTPVRGQPPEPPPHTDADLPF